METTQTPPRPHEDERREAITKLIESVAKQQEALAEILEAEHRKIQKTTELTNVDVDDLVEIDESVERVIAAVTRLELALQLKLDLFHDCLCPEEHRYCCR
ncbi:MAG: hypothetical protein ACI4PO_00510 [Faecousia sp.]